MPDGPADDHADHGEELPQQPREHRGGDSPLAGAAESRRRLGELVAARIAPLPAEVQRRLDETLATVTAAAGAHLDVALGPAADAAAAAVAAAWEAWAPHWAIELPPALHDLLEKLRQRYHAPNWPEDVDLDRMADVIGGDGLPLVWVPPAAVVDAVLDAPDRDARVAVLLEHAEELVADCRRVLTAVTAPRLAAQLPLAPRALDAFTAGHHEAAQALAVLVTDAAIAGWITGNSEAVAAAVHFDPEDVSLEWLRLQAAVAPLASFKTRYFGQGPLPAVLSRHVTVHYAPADHFTSGNGLVAVLLMTSVLRALQEFEEQFANLAGGEDDAP